VARRQALKNKCDKEFSLLVRSLGYCQKCGTSQIQLHCAHIFSRKYSVTRFDLMNVLCLCARCHRWAHDNPAEWIRFIDKEFLGRVDYLIKAKRNIIKNVDYGEILQKIRNRDIKGLTGGELNGGTDTGSSG